MKSVVVDLALPKRPSLGLSIDFFLWGLFQGCNDGLSGFSPLLLALSCRC